MNTKFKLILLIILVAMVSIICIATNSYAAEEESQLEWTDFSNAEIYINGTKLEGEGALAGYKYVPANTETGVEECIVSHPEHNFSSPVVSPNGQWLLFVGSSKIESGTLVYYNTDLFVSKMDGTGFAQLTYHAADDLSPIWSKDGQYIYFISQRGSKEGKANIWRMKFNYQRLYIYY